MNEVVEGNKAPGKPVSDLVDRMLDGDVVALARLITLVESGGDEAVEVMKKSTGAQAEFIAWA